MWLLFSARCQTDKIPQSKRTHPDQGWHWGSRLPAMEHALERWSPNQCKKLSFRFRHLCFALGSSSLSGRRWNGPGRRSSGLQGEEQLLSLWRTWWNTAFKGFSWQICRAGCVLASWTPTTLRCASPMGARRSSCRSMRYSYRCNIEAFWCPASLLI